MKTALLSLVGFTLVTGVCHAQKVGDSEQAVINALGTPPLARASGDRQTWMYTNGTKVVLEAGVVVEVKTGTPNPTAPSEEAALREEARQAALPKTSANVSPSPDTAQKRHDSAWEKDDTGPHTKAGMALALVGVAVMLVCGIMIIVKAFQTSVLWGFGAIFVPFCRTVFVVTHWSETKTPFLVTYLVGLPLVVASLFM